VQRHRHGQDGDHGDGEGEEVHEDEEGIRTKDGRDMDKEGIQDRHAKSEVVALLPACSGHDEVEAGQEKFPHVPNEDRASCRLKRQTRDPLTENGTTWARA